jgi:hypothetical protein
VSVTIMERHVSPPAIIAALGLGMISAIVFVLGLLSGRGLDDLAGGLLVAVAIVIVTVPLLARQARRENDKRIFRLMLAALVLRFCGALARSFVAIQVYGGLSDAIAYHNAGVQLAERFRSGNFDTGLTPLSATNFIKVVTGIVYSFIGPTKLGGYFFFAWLAFLGSFLFYRAFVTALPEGQRGLYALLIFFLPSLVFWPSSIGKEAWLVFTLGLAAFGASQIFSGRMLRGLVFGATGLWLAAYVRPHVAGMLVIAALLAVLATRSKRRVTGLSVFQRGIVLALLVVVAVFLVKQTDEFLRTTTSGRAADFTSTLKEVRRRTTGGGSSFSPPVLDSPQRAPVAIVTVLFRPLIVDAHNAQALISGLEGTLLLLLTMWRAPRVWAAVRTARRHAYVFMCLVFTGLFVVAFSSVANFGLLARERVQLLPFFFVLLTAVPRHTAAEQEDWAASTGGVA